MHIRKQSEYFFKKMIDLSIFHTHIYKFNPITNFQIWSIIHVHAHFFAYNKKKIEE